MDLLILTVKEASEALRVSRTKMYALVLRGDIKTLLIGRSRRISRAALYEFVGIAAPPPESQAPTTGPTRTERPLGLPFAWMAVNHLTVDLGALREALRRDDGRLAWSGRGRNR